MLFLVFRKATFPYTVFREAVSLKNIKYPLQKKLTRLGAARGPLLNIAPAGIVVVTIYGVLTIGTTKIETYYF